MNRVENIRSLLLYQRSLSLALELYRFCKGVEGRLNKKEAEELRSLAVVIPMKIASSVGQVNVIVTFKELNEAKRLLSKLQWKVSKVMEKYQVGKWEQSLLADYHMQVIKLMNAYFGRLSKEKKRLNKDITKS